MSRQPYHLHINQTHGNIQLTILIYKYEKQKDKSNRAKLTKGGSLDDPTMGRENKEVPSDLVMKRGGSAKRKNTQRK